MSNSSSKDIYKIHPLMCARDDFWSQVKRTVNGKPVSQDQIDMIVAAVSSALALVSEDFLLDLCCGNGALSSLFFSKCSGGVGVDYSECLIDIAHEYFQKSLQETYLLADVVDYASKEPRPERFTKALCYGSFQYLSFEQAEKLLLNLQERFCFITSFYIGNLPDKELMDQFFRDREYEPGIEDDHSSLVGIWRTRREFASLANSTGWGVEFIKMPDDFYASHYRYDAIMTPIRLSSRHA